MANINGKTGTQNLKDGKRNKKWKFNELQI